MEIQLSRKEQAELAALETVIATNEKAFIAVGEALKVIQDKKLYRENFQTFPEYCRVTWGWGKSYAYRLIEASLNLVEYHDERIKNEWQVAELGRIPKEKRKEVLDAAEKMGKITRKTISKASGAILGESEPTKTVDLDKTGYAIPNEIWNDWVTANAIGKDLLERIQTCKKEVQRGIEEKSEFFVEIGNPVLADLSNATTGVRRIVPHAVCPSCSGYGRKKCNMCNGRGFVSKFYWDTCIPEEVKEMRGSK